jgi:hypothetical protein
MSKEVSADDLPDNIVPDDDLPDNLGVATPAPVNNDKYKDHGLSTYAANVVNSATFGLPDYLNKTYTPDTYAEGQRYNEANPLAANLGDITGKLVPAVPAYMAGRKAVGYGANKAIDYAADRWAKAQARAAAGAVPEVTPTTRPPGAVPEVTPTTRPPGTTLHSGMAPPELAPVNPNAMPKPVIGGAAAQEGSTFIQRIAQQYGTVASKMAPALGNLPGTIARVATGPFVAGMTYSPDTGPAVPSRGPLRGSEINPYTRRGWTPQEIADYEATIR